MPKSLIFVVTLALLCGPPVYAQSRDLAERLLLAHNQLGLLEFCQGKTFIGPEAVSYQQRLLSLIPELVHQRRAEEARAAGQRGQIYQKGKAQNLPADLDEAAALERFCLEMAYGLVPEGVMPPLQLDIRGGFPTGR